MALATPLPNSILTFPSIFTMMTNPTIAEIAAAQQKKDILAFDRDSDQRRLTRLQAVYAAKREQLEAFYRLFDETTPDFVLRAPDGREFVLRVPEDKSGDIYSAMRDYQDQALKNLEEEIVSQHLAIQQENALLVKYPRQEADYAPAILALCTPMPASAAMPTVETTPSAPVPLPAGERLFVTPTTRPKAALSI